MILEPSRATYEREEGGGEGKREGRGREREITPSSPPNHQRHASPTSYQSFLLLQLSVSGKEACVSSWSATHLLNVKKLPDWIGPICLGLVFEIITTTTKKGGGQWWLQWFRLILPAFKSMSSPWWLFSRRAPADLIFVEVLHLIVLTSPLQGIKWTPEPGQPVNPPQPLRTAKLYRIIPYVVLRFSMSNFIRCSACKHNIVVTVPVTSKPFLLHMCAGEEIPTCMF